jgi:hypothetical protein
MNCGQKFFVKLSLVVLAGGWAAPAGVRALVENASFAMEQPVAASEESDTDSMAEAFSIPLLMDSGGRPLSGEQRYTVTFGPGQLPPAEASWSLTLYSLPEQRLVANSIGRHRIDSVMLPNMKRGADGRLTLYIQKAAPGGDKDANWLPTPAGPFMMILRLDRPDERALDAEWEAPGVVRVQ